ncbi:MAG: hypothetical protein ACK4Z5_04635 [Brevundimonas sp.]
MADAADAAKQRLERALAELERKTRDLKARSSVADDDLFAPRASASPDSELRAAAQAASLALAAAADEIRAVLEAEG